MPRLFIVLACGGAATLSVAGPPEDQAATLKASRATTISISGERTQQNLVQDFATQTGQTIQFDGGPPTITVDWKQVPFWDAIASLEKATNSIAIGDAAQRALVFQPRPEHAPVRSVESSGPCRIEIINRAMRPSLVDSTKDVLQVRWRLQLEPRLRPLYITIADRDCTLHDGDRAIAPLSPDARREVPIDRWKGAEIATVFQIPRSADLSQFRAGLAGQVKVAALPLELTFKDLDQPAPAPRRRGAVTAIVRNVDSNPQLRFLQFDLKVTYDRGGPEFESHRMWIYQNAARLVRKEDGSTMSPAAVELKENAGAGATLVYLFENIHNSPGDFEFVYEAPTLVIDVPFKVENLPLPSTAK